MGMISYFEREDIEIKDWNGLLKFFEFWDKFLKEKYGDLGWERVMSSKKMLDVKTKTLSFESWDDMKLISYWYDVELIFLELISEYIEGDVDWTFENNNEAGGVRFEEGKCIINTGNMEWTEWKPQDDISGKLPKEIKKRFILKNLK